MEEFKGTPGPWINVGGWVDAKKSGDLSSIICAIDSVASINPESVNDANANLISAAPELLEALQLSLTAMNEMGDILNFHDMSDAESVERLTPAFEMARAAIAKALGK